jgi:hypothetical protein
MQQFLPMTAVRPEADRVATGASLANIGWSFSDFIVWMRVWNEPGCVG